jgi:hypothetical protein
VALVRRNNLARMMRHQISSGQRQEQAKIPKKKFLEHGITDITQDWARWKRGEN